MICYVVAKVGAFARQAKQSENFEVFLGRKGE
jgi:hypothetical protein